MESHRETTQTAALLFPDYDSLRPGLLKDIYEHHRVVQEYFEQAEHITQLNIPKIIFNSSKSELMLLPDAYVMLFLLQVSAAEYVRSSGIQITSSGGIGMGMYAALCAAGAITFTDGLYIVSKWGSLYNDFLHDKNVKKIRVQGVARSAIEKILTRSDSAYIDVCEDLGNNSYAVSGMRSAVEGCEEHIIADYPSAVITELPTEGGVYALCMQEFFPSFRNYVEKIECKEPQIPCFGPVALQTAQDVKDFVVTQPFLYQDRPLLIDKYADSESIIIPCADEELFLHMQAHYPEKQITKIL